MGAGVGAGGSEISERILVHLSQLILIDVVLVLVVDVIVVEAVLDRLAGQRPVVGDGDGRWGC